ncbi:uncharacterized protein LOC122809059 isoform X2 [Protopterus annectens]|nr:uncharacterized protein LOC122809059 isoform X2 [Protopterus annectens]
MKQASLYFLRRMQFNCKMEGFLILLTLYAVLITGTALQCYKCLGNGTSCTESKVTCASNATYCGTWTLRQSFAGIITDVFLKNCVSEPKECNTSVASNSSNWYLGAVSECCTTDFCNVEQFNETSSRLIYGNISTAGCPCSASCQALSANCTQMNRYVCMNMTLTILFGGFSRNIWQKQGCVARQDCYKSSSLDVFVGYNYQRTEDCCDTQPCSTAIPSASTTPSGATCLLHLHSNLLILVMTGVLILKHMF